MHRSPPPSDRLRRRRFAVAGLALLAAVGAGLLLWPPKREPSPVAQKARLKTKKPSSAARKDLSGAVDRAFEDQPLLAIPVTEDTAPAEPPEQSPGYVRITAIYPDGAPVLEPLVLRSRDCGIWWRRNEGPTIGFPTRQPACTAQVGRRDGSLYAWSEPLDLVIPPGGAVEASAVLPRERTGGLGVAIDAAPEGVVILEVTPGTPAEAMGLEPGDFIVEVDGLPADALTLDEFISVMTGPAGTQVEFVLGYETDTGWTEEEILLTRAEF